MIEVRASGSSPRSLRAPTGQTPPVVIEARSGVVTSQSRNGHQQHPPRLESAPHVHQCDPHVRDQVQRLREDDAVESLRRERVRLVQVGDQRGGGVGRIDVEHIPSTHPRTAEAFRVVGVQDLETSPWMSEARDERKSSM